MQFEEWIIYGYEGSYDFVIQIVIVNDEGDILHVKDTFECSCRGLLFINAFGELTSKSRRAVVGFTVDGYDDERKLMNLVK